MLYAIMIPLSNPVMSSSCSFPRRRSEWKQCCTVMVEAYRHLRLLHTSIIDVYTVFELLVCCLMGMWVHPYTVTPAKFKLAQILGYMFTCGVKIRPSHLLEEWKWCHNVMFEADIYLGLLPTSTLGIRNMFEPLVCCFKGIWVHPYTATPAKLAPYLGSHGHLRNENDAITSWLRLISTSDCCINPY
jgi:hypothetical protein